MIKYGDLVKVKTGFYEACRGLALGYDIENHLVEIDIKKCIGVIVYEKTILIHEDNLEIIEENT